MAWFRRRCVENVRVGDLSRRELLDRLRPHGVHRGLRLRTGPFVMQICSTVSSVVDGIQKHYASHKVEADEAFADFHVGVEQPSGLRRWLKPQARFVVDGASPFNPLPLEQGFALLEWGMNWCVSAHAHQYLILHAAVVAHNHRGLVMPAASGSGKSTLCAGLALRGWRVLSDELALIDPNDATLQPLTRPISLKNHSIGLIQAMDVNAVLSEPVHDTIKGTVAHLKVPQPSVDASSIPAQPTWVVVPTFEEGATAQLVPLPRSLAFMHMAEHAFNYSVHGDHGFEALAAVVDRCDCYALRFGDLEQGLNLVVETLTASVSSP